MKINKIIAINILVIIVLNISMMFIYDVKAENIVNDKTSQTTENNEQEQLQNQEKEESVEQDQEHIQEQPLEQKKEKQEEQSLEEKLTKQENTVIQTNETKENIENSEKKLDETLEEKGTISYRTHVQNVGWQGWKSDGEMAGTEAKSLRLEAINIKTTGLKNVKVKYRVHIQNIGWQSWKNDGEMAGTEAKSLRLEAINILLDSTDNYSIQYRVHVQNIGWQNWKTDGEMAGTEGKSLRLEAIQIRIVPKQQKAKIVLETPSNGTTYFSETKTINVQGWKMANVSNSTIKAYLDNSQIDDSIITNYTRKDVENSVLDYGTTDQNPKPGFKFDIDATKLDEGVHNIKVELYVGNKLFVTTNSSFKIDRQIHVRYRSHVQNIGWQPYLMDEAVSGTVGKDLRVEALNIEILNVPSNLKIKYKSHVQNVGWQSWKEQGETTGTTGKDLRLEAIRIKLDYSNEYTVQYRVHIQNKGWQAWKEEDEIAGTIGQSLRIEAIQIKLTKKTPKTKIKIENEQNVIVNSPRKMQITGWRFTNLYNTELKVFIDDSSTPLDEKYITYQKRDDILSERIGYGTEDQNQLPGFIIKLPTEDLSIDKHTAKIVVMLNEEVQAEDTLEFEVKKYTSIEYSTHVQNIGWQEYVDNNETAGAIESGLRLEAIKINLYNYAEEGTIQYSTYVQDEGWQEFVNNNEVSGTTGKDLRLEAIKIRLTGNLSEKYDIYYRTYIQNIGWLAWTLNGKEAGTQGESLRVGALQIQLVPKDENIDTSGKAFITKPKLSYQTHVQNIGWQQYINDGGVSGTVGKSLRLEAIRLKIDDTNLSGTIQCSAHIQNIGWRGYVDGSQLSGTVGQDLRLEAVKIRLTGELEQYFDIYYRTHVEKLGWISWAKNGEASGTQGYAYRLEAIQIKLVPKGGAAPGATAGHFYNKDLERKTIEGVKLVLGKVCAGIDVSSHQGSINWEEVKNQVDFVIIRCGYGQNFNYQDDVTFETNIEECIKYNIPVEVYLYSYADTTAKAFSEADHVMRLCNKYKSHIRKIWYDVEDSSVFTQISQGNLSKETLGQIVDTFANRLKSVGYDVGLYTYSYALNNYFTANTKNKYDIWIANYPGNSQDIFEARYNLFKTLYKMWQFTSEGVVSGINGSVDMSIRF